MTLSDDVQLATTLLQAVGLILPVVFIALQPYYEDVVNSTSRIRRRTSGSSDDYDEVEQRTHDNAPLVVLIGMGAAALIAASGLFAAAKVWLAASGWLVRIAIMAFAGGFLCLAVMMGAIRREFITVEDVI